MLRHERSAPIWLFSFVDLAFLLLIAFTQISPDAETPGESIAWIEVPQISGPGEAFGPSESAAPWQLRVHPLPVTDGVSHTPYRLIQPGQLAEDALAIGADALAEHLVYLSQRDLKKPILAPHADARAEDLLVAVSLLEDAWQGSRRVAVHPGSPLDSVSAAPAQVSTP